MVSQMTDMFLLSSLLHRPWIKFMNTSTSAESVASIELEGRYLDNQTPWAVEILIDCISHGPLTESHMVQNKTSELPMKSLHNTTA